MVNGCHETTCGQIFAEGIGELVPSRALFELRNEQVALGLFGKVC
jgi:hypothetical protein